MERPYFGDWDISGILPRDDFSHKLLTTFLANVHKVMQSGASDPCIRRIQIFEKCLISKNNQQVAEQAKQREHRENGGDDHAHLALELSGLLVELPQQLCCFVLAHSPNRAHVHHLLIAGISVANFIAEAGEGNGEWARG